MRIFIYILKAVATLLTFKKNMLLESPDFSSVVMTTRY